MSGYYDEVNQSEEFNIIQEDQKDIECDDSISVDEILNETETNNNLEEETIMSTTTEVQPELIEVKQEETEQEVGNINQPSDNENVEFIQPEFVNVKIKFPTSATPIDCVSAATNCREKIVAANKQIRLLQNRFYFIPVDCDERIDSDNYSGIKIYSTQADKIDVRYVKNGFACLISMKHNVKLYDDELLAVLY
ncbi:hypothetical protein K9L16_04145 [Candidatus Pacearchaeota archaeon]|nr:hypothetical protein [Candidatus Pacearchaeota archaeon]